MPDKKLVYTYIKKQPLACLAGAYIILFLLLKSIWYIDIGIPCLWRTFFHIKCPGCGITRAGYCLLTMDIKGAAQSNPLIFIIVPATAYYLIQDFRKFRIKSS